MLHLKLHWLKVCDSNDVNSMQLSQRTIVEKVWPHSQKREQLISRTANQFSLPAHLESLYTLSFLFIVILAPNKLRKHMSQWVMITSVCYGSYGEVMRSIVYGPKSITWLWNYNLCNSFNPNPRCALFSPSLLFENKLNATEWSAAEVRIERLTEIIYNHSLKISRIS